MNWIQTTVEITQFPRFSESAPSLILPESIVRWHRVPMVADGRSRGHYVDSDDDDDVESRLRVNEDSDELTIIDVRRSDASTYSCRAYNTVGAATRTYTLVVQGSNTYVLYVRKSVHAFRFVVLYCIVV